MVKPQLYTLALRALRVNQEVATHITRIQHGFLPGRNIEQAQQTIQNMQEMLREMQDALNAPKTDSTRHSNFVPLK